MRLPIMGARRGRGAVEGVVVHADRFGNLVTSIRADDAVGDGTIEVRIAGRRLPLVRTYGDLPLGRAGALVGSHGRLEVVVREGSAAERLRARRGAKVVMWRRATSPARRPRSSARSSGG
ncbi:MAG: SAM-dependent chlorinase/fluorinase [Candidatus Rokubacteria bacterium]|nr:SAM-dependent chlorinase/fluorinase [Candidatus Rokubacteria bacterium]